MRRTGVDVSFCMRKRCKRIVSVVLMTCMITGVAAESEVSEIKARTIEVDPIDMASRYAAKFEDSELVVNDKKNIVTIIASDEYQETNDILFDPVSMGSATEEVVLTDEEYEREYGEREIADTEKLERDIENSETEVDGQDKEVKYECSFDMEKLVYEFKAELVASDGTVVDTEQITTNAIITENGGLDARIIVDGQEYLMSDYENTSSIDNCSIASVIKMVEIYLAVSETAEKLKAKSNYADNRKLEADGNGVAKGKYVYNQADKTTQDYKAGNYQFGFTSFKNVGCEVAAAYNAAYAIHDTERLSQTIYYFEAWALEFSIGWGRLGSNPLEIDRYLKKRGISYAKYTTLASLKTALGKKTKCSIIMSRWNNPVTDGLHTFYVKKTGKGSYYGYNWDYYKFAKSRSDKQSSIASFNDGSGFVVGYIVWGD